MSIVLRENREIKKNFYSLGSNYEYRLKRKPRN